MAAVDPQQESKVVPAFMSSQTGNDASPCLPLSVRQQTKPEVQRETVRAKAAQTPNAGI